MLEMQMFKSQFPDIQVPPTSCTSAPHGVLENQMFKSQFTDFPGPLQRYVYLLYMGSLEMYMFKSQFPDIQVPPTSCTSTLHGDARNADV